MSRSGGCSQASRRSLSPRRRCRRAGRRRHRCGHDVLGGVDPLRAGLGPGEGGGQPAQQRDADCREQERRGCSCCSHEIPLMRRAAVTEPIRLSYAGSQGPMVNRAAISAWLGAGWSGAERIPRRRPCAPPHAPGKRQGNGGKGMIHSLALIPLPNLPKPMSRPRPPSPAASRTGLDRNARFARCTVSPRPVPAASAEWLHSGSCPSSPTSVHPGPCGPANGP